MTTPLSNLLDKGFRLIYFYDLALYIVTLRREARQRISGENSFERRGALTLKHHHAHKYYDA